MTPVKEGRSRSGRAKAPGAATAEEFDVPAEEFDALRAWRLGRAEGKPAFTVATDATLRELLARRPGSVGELIEVRGIGPSFCEKHGESLMEELGRLA